MKLLSLFTYFVGTLGLSVNSTYMDRYNIYIQTYHKNFSYDNFETFKNNVKQIEEFNQQNNSYQLEINQFTDVDNLNRFMMNIDVNEVNDYYEIDDNMIVPEEVDWREKNAVTNVKNQGHCGGCWAFSTTGSVEGIVAIDTGVLQNISEQQLIDCSTSNNGCEGGIMDQAFEYIIDNGGLCSEEEYPYEGVDGTCNSGCKKIVQIKKYGNIYRNNEKILKRAVAQQPVSVAIQANITSFQQYSRGVYSDNDCGDQLDHGVLIVGYGYDTNVNMDYWTVKNSWGPLWGENGYIRIQRNINNDTGMCGIAMMPSIPLL